MADEGDTPTALDVLINAIRGPPYAREDGALPQAEDTVTNLAQYLPPAEAGSSSAGLVDQTKIIDILTKLSLASARNPRSFQAVADGLTRVEVWHPTTAQKSYAAERRVLTPSPLLRVSGPLASSLTNATISTRYLAADAEITSSQTHHVPLDPLADPPLPSGMPARRAEREQRHRRMKALAARKGFAATLAMEKRKLIAREREVLQDGLAFSGLWAGGKKGKEKHFKLELKIGQPGEDALPVILDPPVLEPSTEHTSPGVLAIHPAFGQADVAALGEIFGTGDLDGLSGLRDHEEIDRALLNLSDHMPTDLGAPDETLQTEETLPSGDGPSDDIPQLQPAPDGEETSEDTMAPIAAAPAPPAWATFPSPAIDMVSKPSIRTAKSRITATFLTTSSVFGLWTRIHSQTVRTKYMKVDLEPAQPVLGGESGAGTSSAKFSAKTGKWTPFRFEVVSLAEMPVADSKRPKREESEHILTYGSVVTLVDLHTGVRSDPLRLLKVEKGEVEVGVDHGQPISVLQRLGLVRVDEHESQSRWYLSAPGARAGGAELMTPEQIASIRRRKLPARSTLAASAETLAGADEASRPKKKVRTRRHALAKAVVAEDEEGSTLADLEWAQAAVETRPNGTDTDIVVDKVEDWMCWIIGGVSSFSYSFFDTVNWPTMPSAVNDPPRLLAEPIMNAEHATLQLILSPSAEGMGVYLGPLQPLRVSMWRSTATDDGISKPATALSRPPNTHQELMSPFPSSTEHILLVVELPPRHTVQAKIKELQSDSPTTFDQPVIDNAEPGIIQAPDESSLWLQHDESMSGQPDEEANSHTIDTETLHLATEQSQPVEETAAGTVTETVDQSLQTLQDQSVQEQLARDHIELIDPELQNLADVESHPAETEVKAESARQPVVAHLPHQPNGAEKGPLALPLVLIRPTDGVGFCLGKGVSVVSAGEGEGTPRLCIVDCL